MSVYRGLHAASAAIDRRQTRYRFELEADVRWSELDRPGAFFGPAFLGSLGIGQSGAHPRFQWAFALATCEEFIALEQVILRFAEQQAGALGDTRSLALLVDEEIKHIALFRRYAAHLRAQHPDWNPGFDRAWAEVAHVVGHLDQRSDYPDDGSYHFVFWLNTLFFEEYTIFVHALLDQDAAAIQPAWLSAHAAHRREEEQHLVTDATYLGVLDLDRTAREHWSKLFCVKLSEHFGDFFGVSTARKVLAEVDPAAAQALGAPHLEGTPFFRELCSGRAFRRTQQAAPYVTRLQERARATVIGPGVVRYKISRGDRPVAPDAVKSAVVLDAEELAVRDAWAAALGVTAASIGLDDSFLALGGDSQKAVEVHGRLERVLGRSIDHRILVDCRTVREFALFLRRPDPLVEEVPASAADTREPIAIVAMAGRFPGAPDLARFAALLREGRSAIGAAPAGRVDLDRYYDPDPRARGRIVCRAGGFLDDVRGFDPAAFGLSDDDAREMDPQQRLFVELCAELLDQSGPRAGGHSGSGRRVGVFAGAGWNDYVLRYTDRPERINARTALGNLENMVAARAAQLLSLTGPAITVNAACASSLVAIHLACRSLRAGECDAAIAGAAELNLTVTPWLLFSQAGVLSPTGRCQPFSREAAGFVPGEGGGAVLLKSLASARRDGDTILGLVRGSAMNNDGGGFSGMAPSPAGQLEVLRAAWQDAGLPPGSASYLEAHGSATPIGDAVEVRALGLLFEDAPGTRALGSVKGNLGHLFTAAGIASVIKVLLMMRARELWPTHGCETPDERLGLAEARLRPVQHAEPWRESEPGARRAGVSGFGVGGTNAHVVLEEAPTAATPLAPRQAEVLCLSAPSDADLVRVAAADHDWLAARPEVSLADMAAAINARAARFPVRRALVVNDRADALMQLAEVRAGVRADRPRLAFVLPGPGSQFPGMGAHLFRDEPVFRDAIAECGARLAGRLPAPLVEYLYQEGNLDAPRMDRIELTQPIVFSFGWACAAWLKSLGITPDALVGHSAGEYLAACLANVLTLDQALELVTARGECMARSAAGRMAAVFATPEQVAPLLDGEVGFAAINEPTQVVVSGATAAVDALLARLTAMGITSRPLAISCAAHSVLMEPVKIAFQPALAHLIPRKPALPIFSTVDGGRLVDFDAAYLLRHLSSPVRFADAIKAASLAGIGLFVELGASGALSHCINQVLGDDRALPLARRSVAGWQPTLETLGRLHEAGLSLDANRGRPRAALPGHPYARRPVWIDDAPLPLSPQISATSLADDPAIRDHRVHGQPIAPGAWLFDRALAGARAVDPGITGLVDVVIGRSLPGDARRQVQVRLTGDDVVVESTSDAGPAELHLSGRVIRRASATPPLDLAAIRARVTDEIDIGRLYAHLADSALTYGEALRTVDSVRRGVDEVLVTLAPRVPSSARFDPAIVDGAMQAIGAFTLDRDGQPGTFLGFGIGAIEAPLAVGAPCVAHVVLRSPVEVDTESFRVDATLADLDGRVLMHLSQVALKRQHPPSRPRAYALRWQRAEKPPLRTLPEQVTLLAARGAAPDPRAAALKRRLTDGGVAVREVADAAQCRGALAVIAVAPELSSLRVLAQTLDANLPCDLFVVASDAALSGYLRAIAVERPGWRCRAVELHGDAAMPSLLAAALALEWRGDSSEMVTALAGVERRVPLLQPLASLPGSALRERGVYWITGGTGGLGRTLARHLARHAHARIVLSGRAATVDNSLLDELVALGGEPLYLCADVCDRRAMAAARTAVEQRFGALHGVIHAAGVLDDQLLDGRVAERQAAVLAPKVAGAEVLSLLLGEVALDFMIYCGSLAALFPVAGQSDYAAANAHLDGRARNPPPAWRRVLAIDSGAWRAVGMQASPENERRVRAAGLVPMDPEAAALALFAALVGDASQVVLVGLDPEREAAMRAAFNRARSDYAQAGLPTAELKAADEIVSEGPPPPIRDFLRRELARKLRRPDVDPHASFSSLGVDSLMAVEVVRKLERRYRLRLFPTLLFEHRTIEAVALHLGVP